MDSNIIKSESDTFNDTHFDDIRPLNDTEVKDSIDFLLNDKWFRIIVEPLISPISWKDFSIEMRSCKKVIDFQRNVIYTIIYKFIAGNVEDLELLNPREIDLRESHMYISIHSQDH